MTPQSDFMVLAPIVEGRRALEALLAGMNLPGTPGMADPKNTLVPFGKLESLHFARFVIVDDETLADFAEIGEPVPSYPVTLAFLGDCDGPAEAMLAALVREAGPGLGQIFSHCGFVPGSDLLAWMQRHSRRPAAAYVNWLGRTVRQIREEAELYEVLRAYIRDHAAELERADAQTVRAKLVQAAAAVSPTLPQPTPFGWCLRNLVHLAIVPGVLILPWLIAVPWLVPLPKLLLPVVAPFLALSVLLYLRLLWRTGAALALLAALALMLVPLLILFPLLLIPLAAAVVLFLAVLRRYEKSEPEVIFRPSHAHDEALARLEDHDVSNQFTALGSVKPSRFRRWLFIVILWLIDYGARHIYNRGFLSRIQSIHFARWVFLDGKRRVLFASNYDGNRQAYMDDFINKTGWGLNLAFGNGFGYPRTNWLIRDGSKNELSFKDTNRRHQVATQVWYKAYPGLTAYDLARNARIRRGLERERMSDDDICAWLREL